MASEPWHPHPYQQRAVEFCLERPAAGLFLDPGLGKTSSTLKVLQHLDGPALVLAPLRVARHVWRQEVLKWRDFHGMRVVLLHGPDRDQRLREPADVFVTNYESLPWLTATTQWKRLKSRTLVCDESSRIKNNDTQRFRLLKPKLTSFDRRYILTGSPAPNSLMDLWSQIFLLDLGKSLSPFITHFRAMHFHPLEYGWVLKPGHEQIIYEAIADLCLRLDADDYLKLPQRVTSTVLVDLPDGVRAIYDDMETQFFAELESGGDILASNKGGALMKCRQIAAGAVYTDFPCTRWEPLHDAKLEAVKDRLDEIGGHPTLIAYQFQHSLARLRALLGGATPSLPARTPREEDAIIARWNAGEIPVLLGQPASMGHGLNLQGAAHHVIFYDLPWNFDDYDQTVRRLQRQGQEHDTVFVTHLEADRTVDQAISRALQKKDTSQRGLLTYLKEYRHTM